MTRSSAAAADRETAVRLAGQRLATLEAVEGVTAGDSQGQFEEEPRFQWQQRLTGASEAGVLEVTVTVLWQDGAIQRHYDVTTYMLDPNQSSAAGSTTGVTSGAGGGNGGGR